MRVDYARIEELEREIFPELFRDALVTVAVPAPREALERNSAWTLAYGMRPRCRRCDVALWPHMPERCWRCRAGQ